MALWKIYNGPAPTTAAQVAVTTGTAIETALQIKMQPNFQPKIRAWGVSMNGSAAAAGAQWELVETGTIFGTVTAHVAAGIVPWDGDAMRLTSTDFFDVGVADTGYTCTSEGSIVASRTFDSQFVQPSGERAWEFSLGNEPQMEDISALRVRVTVGAAIDAICWVLLEL